MRTCSQSGLGYALIEHEADAGIAYLQPGVSVWKRYNRACGAGRLSRLNQNAITAARAFGVPLLLQERNQTPYLQMSLLTAFAARVLHMSCTQAIRGPEQRTQVHESSYQALLLMLNV